MTKFSRKTKETEIKISLDIRGSKIINVATGIGFFELFGLIGI